MKYLAILFLFLFCGIPAHTQSFKETDKMKKYEGFFTFYYQENQDRIYLEVKKLNEEFLYVHSLSWGVGHNDLLLDRGQLGNEPAVVCFKKAGNKILMVQSNLKFRAGSTNRYEKEAVEQAFARSVLQGFEIKDQRNGVYLIDLSEFLLSDAHGVGERLSGSHQGNYSVDMSRSALDLTRTKAFPENVEFEALLTLTGKPEGALITSVTPDPHHVSVVQHHSFVKLPDGNYTPRIYHPQSGSIFISYMDFATPVYEPIEKRFIIRHRIEPDKPIIYYLDNGTPEPVRSALLEGGNWWSEAFDDIGFKNGFRVEMLPEGADPMDVRYNMIQWVHRSTRGWSYGSSVVDPRTGEIIKGHVTLGSLRIRQDFLIAQALLDRPYAKDDENHREMLDLALARIRQLSAHEIGHTLGFSHNFAASASNNASVMDYPHPLVTIENGKVSIDHAYSEGIGEWDKVTVAYAYTEFKENEKENLQKILTNASHRGLRYISDADARARGGAHPVAHLWDNGTSAIDGLDRILEVRQLAIRNFSADNIRNGEPYSTLEDLFVPLYFFHRYQLEAATKLIGGVDYNYAVKGDEDYRVSTVDPDIQRRALTSVLRTLSPKVLIIPEDKLILFPPRPPGYEATRESFDGQTGITFDYFAAPAVAANLTLDYLLHPERVNRLVQQKALNSNQPGLEDVLASLVDRTVKLMADKSGYETAIGRTVNFIVIDHLIRVASDEHVSPQAKAIARQQLTDLKSWLEMKSFSKLNETCRLAYIDQIKEFKVRHLSSLPKLPPGAPIGMECMDY